MAQLYAHPQATKDEAIRLVVEEGYSYAEAGDAVGVTKNTVAGFLRQHQLNIAARVDYTGIAPRNLAPKDAVNPISTALRAIAEQLAGIPVRGPRAQEAEKVRIQSEKLICVYDPSLPYSFYWIPREAGDNRWLIDMSD